MIKNKEKMILLSEESNNDPFAMQLINCAEEKGFLIELVTPKSILNGTAHKLLQDNNYYILNRLPDEVSQEHIDLFKTKQNTAMEYRLSVENFLSSVDACSSKPGLYSLVGNKFPLNLQWKIILDKFKSLSTPEFYYVFGREEKEFTEDMKKKGYIKMDPNIIYDWTDNTLENQWHPFYVKKPCGQAYIYSFIEDNSLLLNIEGSDVDDVKSHGILKEVLPKIRKSFRAYSGEILFFKDDDKLVYGGLSHSHASSSRSNSYPGFVKSWFEKSFTVGST